MRVTFLGTGTSHGVPMIGCDCAVCRSDDVRNRRLRPSILVASNGRQVLVDASTDFRTQALRETIRHVDDVLITHVHADHVLGLDDLRAFNKNGKKMPIHGSADTIQAIQRMFPYACTDTPAWPNLPSFDLRLIDERVGPRVDGFQVRALNLPHGRMPVHGFLFDDELAYFTDCSDVPPAAVAAARGVTVLVIDGLRYRPHPAHLTIGQAVAIVGKIQPRFALLTHLCHEVDHASAEAELPEHIRVAYDGMKLEIANGAYEVAG